MLPRPVALGLAAILYGAVALTANASLAGALTPQQQAEIEAMSRGDMKKLVLRAAPGDRLTSSFQSGEGGTIDLGAFRGKLVVLNLWATWCPPCRAEMPSLDRLAQAVAGDGIAVVAVSADRGGVPAVERFFKDTGVTNLRVYNDRANRLPREAGVMGLPVTLILDPQGREIGRVTGDAEWDSPEAVAVLRRIADFTSDSQSALGAPATSVAAAE